MKRRLAALAEAIALEERCLVRLDAERAAILARLGELRVEFSVLEAGTMSSQELSNLSSTEKITLFRSLFRGREDVFPKLWISKNGDSKGYMPACANDGSYTLCGKRQFPRVKCG